MRPCSRARAVATGMAGPAARFIGGRFNDRRRPQRPSAQQVRPPALDSGSSQPQATARHGTFSIKAVGDETLRQRNTRRWPAALQGAASGFSAHCRDFSTGARGLAEKIGANPLQSLLHGVDAINCSRRIKPVEVRASSPRDRQAGPHSSRGANHQGRQVRAPGRRARSNRLPGSRELTLGPGSPTMVRSCRGGRHAAQP